jgi:coenzyme PQQ precursor peptide PqqA
MIHWTKPAFEELDVSGECTAYAGALRAERLAGEPRGGRLTAARRDPSASERPAEEGSTPAPRRDSTL